MYIALYSFLISFRSECGTCPTLSVPLPFLDIDAEKVRAADNIECDHKSKCYVNKTLNVNKI